MSKNTQDVNIRITIDANGKATCKCGFKGEWLAVAFHLCPLEDKPQDYGYAKGVSS